ncbi:MAG: polyprenyl synthetase family protein [Deltaproteobacteria bacterium]|nr:polyprenyl synthetase family protein [Deltaproteobacteria bacterium]
MDDASVDALLQRWRAQLDLALARHLATTADEDGARPPARLVDAMAHSLLAPGKRLRPLLVLAAARALLKDEAGALDAAQDTALALELVHTYSLIHDDLPALDDDALRRGRPTLHVAFDEATAILAGDALLTDAFALAAGAGSAAVRELARAAGSAGMVGGQFDDVAAEGTTPTLEVLARIHAKKTGRLFEAACVLGGLCARGSDDQVGLLRALGRHLGLAFQIADDLLDVTAGAAADKGTGRDARHDKATWVKLLGEAGARARAQHEADAGVALAARLGDDVLATLCRRSVARMR